MDASGILTISLVIGAVALFVLVALFLAGRLGKRRHEMSRAGLEKRTVEESKRIRALVDEREAVRPEGDSVIKERNLPSRRVTLHDEGTREIYVRDRLPEVAELRRQLGKHGVRDETFDALYESAENGSDLRTVSTALSEMARRLRPKE